MKVDVEGLGGVNETDDGRRKSRMAFVKARHKAMSLITMWSPSFRLSLSLEQPVRHLFWRFFTVSRHNSVRHKHVYLFSENVFVHRLEFYAIHRCSCRSLAFLSTIISLTMRKAIVCIPDLHSETCTHHGL